MITESMIEEEKKLQEETEKETRQQQDEVRSLPSPLSFSPVFFRVCKR